MTTRALCVREPSTSSRPTLPQCSHNYCSPILGDPKTPVDEHKASQKWNLSETQSKLRAVCFPFLEIAEPPPVDEDIIFQDCLHPPVIFFINCNQMCYFKDGLSQEASNFNYLSCNQQDNEELSHYSTLSWVMALPEDLQQFLVADVFWLVDNSDHLCMTCPAWKRDNKVILQYCFSSVKTQSISLQCQHKEIINPQLQRRESSQQSNHGQIYITI